MPERGSSNPPDTLFEIPIDAIGDSVCVLDDTYTIVAVNSAWRRFAEENPPIPRSYGIGVKYDVLCERIAGADAEEAHTFLHGLRAVLQGTEQCFRFEYGCHAPAKERWFRASVVRFGGDAGHRLLVTHTDITREHRTGMLRALERERCKQLLHESNTKYRILFESMKEGAFYQNANGCLEDVNEAALAILGVTREEFLGRTSEFSGWNIIAGDGTRLKPEEHPSMRALFSGKPVDSMTVGIWNPAKQGYRWASASAIPLFREGASTPIQVFVTIHDLTEWKEREDQLRYQAALLDQISDTITATDLEERITYVNRAVTQKLGRSREELIGATPEVFGDDPLRGATQRQIAEATRRDGEWYGEVVNRSCDGREIVALLRTLVVRDEAGRPIGMCGIGTDITERKQAEEALRKSEERYALVIAGSGAAIWDWDVQNKRVQFSPRWKAMRGYAEHEILGTEEEWRSGIHPDDKERVNAAVLAHFRGQTRLFKEDYRVRHKDGSWIWISDSGIAQRDESGQVVRMAGSETDITERKIAEGALRHQEALYRGVVESSADGFVILDLAGRIVEVNPAYCRLSGYSREELLASMLAMLEANEDQAAISDHIDVLMRKGSDLFETRHRKKDGTVWQVQVNASYWPIAGGRCFAFFRDLVERNRSEILLRTRFRLVALAATVPLEALMQAALDDVEVFTGSSLAFLHYVDGEQGLLTMEAVSTNTIGRLERSGTNAKPSLISPEGPWADCIRSRVPVILNAMPDPLQEGVRPNGHIPIHRALVVPVIREDRIIALVGVGNKTTGYTQDDVAMVEALASIAIDIVESVRAKHRLQTSEERFRMLYQMSEEGILHTDPLDGSILSANPAACTILDQTEEQICVHGRSGVLDPEDPRGMLAIQERARHGRVTAEFGLLRGDGTRIEVIGSSAMYTLSDGRVRSDIIFRDITARRRVEATLRKLSAAIEFSPLSVLITDNKGNIEYVNPRFEQVTGYGKAEVLGRNPRFLQSGSTPVSVYQDLWAAVGKGEMWRGEFQNKRKDGTQFWEEAWIAPIPAPGTDPGHIVGLKEDITERKHIEQLLEHQAEALGAFAAHLEAVRENERTSVAREVHDAFGQILSAIKLDAIMLGTPDMGDPEHTARRVSSILALADSGMKTVHEIAARLRPGILDNLGLVAALEWQLEDFQKRTGVNCAVHLPAMEIDLEPEVATAFFRCAQALLTNVVLHARARAVVFSFRQEAGDLVLVVSDDGAGITESAIDSPRSFGLVGIRERLRPLGGILTLRTLPSGGTDARITVPLNRRNASHD